MVPLLDVYISRRYAIGFLEKMQDGTHETRNQQEEDLENSKWQNKFAAAYEYAMHEHERTPNFFESFEISGNVQDCCQEYAKLKAPPRNVHKFVNLRIVDFVPQSIHASLGTFAMLTVWSYGNFDFDTLKEGKRFLIQNLGIKNNWVPGLTFNSVRNTRFIPKEAQECDLKRSGFIGRELIKTDQLKYCSPKSQIDIILLVLDAQIQSEIKSQNSTKYVHIMLCTDEKEALVIVEMKFAEDKTKKLAKMKALKLFRTLEYEYYDESCQLHKLNYTNLSEMSDSYKNSSSLTDWAISSNDKSLMKIESIKMSKT